MAKVKIHELAKELDIQSKDIIALLQGKGIEAKSHMSSIEDDAIDYVKKSLQKAAKGSTGMKKAAEQAAEVKAPVTEKATEMKAPAAENAAEKVPAAEKPEAAPVKKKKNIIFVSNPQNSKLPGGQQMPKQMPKPTPAPERKAVPAPSKPVAETPAAPVQQTLTPAPKPEASQTAAKEPENAAPAASTPAVPQKAAPTAGTQSTEAVRRPAGQERDNTNYRQSNYQGNRPSGGEQRSQGGYHNQGNRPAYQGSGQGNYQGSRQGGGQGNYQGNRGSYQGQGGQGGGQGNYQGNRQGGGQGNYQGNRQGGSQGNYQGNRQGGSQGNYQGNRGSYQGQGGQSGYQGNRPAYQNQAGGNNGNYRRNEGGEGSGYQRPAQGRPGAYPGAGANRPYGNSGGGQRSDGRENDRFKGTQGGRTFNADAPLQGTEKKRDDEKRRISQEKDKRNKKDLAYEEDKTQVKKSGRFIKPEKKEAVAEEKIKVIIIPELLTIKDLADKMKIQPSLIVKKLFLQGRIVTVNQEITFEDAEEIAIEYEIICEKEVKVDVIEELLKEEDEEEGTLTKRPPVICVMGHVDHGKTSLLDAIRETNVTDREAGGITQHIGAYTVAKNGQSITFLDTPGHEAFTAMRMRGANATDIAILVVAADDGVMPQTVEAINHAKAAGIEIIVAINKVDKPNANIDRVKQELTEHELIAEDWGGSTVFAPVSAKTGEGIEQLLEMILLTAEILELKANPKRRARGLVIEAQLDKGRGPVASILVQKGTLRIGDFIAAGSCHGKVRAMLDDKGRRVKEAGPSSPVEILGLNDVPNAGDVFVAPETDKEAKGFADTFISHGKEKLLDDTKAKMSLDDLFTKIQAGNLKELNIIIKADVQGSVEAVKQSLLKLSNEEVLVKIIHGGVGAVNESDVILASTSSAIIIAFNVRPDVSAKAIAEREGVDIRLYKVIYQAIEDIEAAMKGMLEPIYEERVIGHAEVRQIFKASALGNIAGSYVLDGIFKKGCSVRITREGNQIFEGALGSLKRFKDDVKEVKAGYECGLIFEGFDQMQELDIVEAYIMVEVPRQ